MESAITVTGSEPEGAHPSAPGAGARAAADVRPGDRHHAGPTARADQRRAVLPPAPAGAVRVHRRGHRAGQRPGPLVARRAPQHRVRRAGSRSGRRRGGRCVRAGHHHRAHPLAEPGAGRPGGLAGRVAEGLQPVRRAAGADPGGGRASWSTTCWRCSPPIPQLDAERGPRPGAWSVERPVPDRAPRARPSGDPARSTTTYEPSRGSIVGLLATIGIATVGLRVAAIAVPWFVLTSSGSAAQTGLVVAAELGPYVLAKAVGGPLVDRLGSAGSASPRTS